MNKTWILTLTCLLPAVAFGQSGIVKIGGEILTQGGKTAVERTAQRSTGLITNGMRGSVLKQMDVPFPGVTLPSQTALKRSVAQAAQAAQPVLAVQTSSILSQRLSHAITAAQTANNVLFNMPLPAVPYGMDSYPQEMAVRIQEDARIMTEELPLPLSSEELELLVAADKEGKFFEVDENLEKDDVVATYRKRMHVNVRPGSFMASTNIGSILKIEKGRYADLQRTVATLSDDAIKDLKSRAAISYYDGPRQYLTYDEFRGLVASGDKAFFGEPFLAQVNRAYVPVDTVGVFFPLKKNLVVSYNTVFYSLPAGSYVCVDEFGGAIDRAHFLFDAKPLMRAFSPQTADQLQGVFRNAGAEQPLTILMDQEGKLPYFRHFYPSAE